MLPSMMWWTIVTSGTQGSRTSLDIRYATMYRELIRALGVKLLGTTAMELMKVFTNLRSELKY
jgi:hypothetical protein